MNFFPLKRAIILSGPLAFLLSFSSNCLAQGIERDSLAGEASAASLKGSDLNAPYNIKLGPVNITASGAFIGTYDDNINIANTGRQADFILEPKVVLGAVWQATDLNALNLNIGLGYQDYLNHNGASGPVISPNSNLQFNLFVDDFKITFHDEFLFQQDPVEVGQLSNISQFSRFQNNAGIRTDWDLGELVASVGYDHTNYWVFQSIYKYLDSDTDSFSPRVTVHVSPTIDAGMDASFGLTSYDQNIESNYTSFAIGPFAEARLSDNLAVNARMGYYMADYSGSGLNGDESNANSFYAEGGVNHRVNNILSEQLTVGRQYIPGLTSNYTDEMYVRYSAYWQTTKYISISPNFSFQNLKDSGGTFAQSANIYSMGASIGYQLTDKLSLNLGYQFILKDANLSSLGYYQNSVSMGATYAF